MWHITTMRGRESSHCWDLVHLPSPCRVQAVVKTYKLQSRQGHRLCYKLAMKCFSFSGFIHKHHCCFFSGHRWYHCWIALFMWQDKSKPFVLRDVLQCCSCHSQALAAAEETALHRGLGQRRVEHESLWHILALHHKWTTGLGLEHLGLNLFTQTQHLPFSQSRQLLCVCHSSTTALQKDARLWMLVEGLRDMSCSAAGVLDNPNKGARSVASNPATWTESSLDRAPGWVWGEGRWVGVESCGSSWLRRSFPKGPAHSFTLGLFFHQQPERSSLEHGYTQTLSFCQSKGWGFCLPQFETIWEI